MAPPAKAKEAPPSRTKWRSEAPRALTRRNPDICSMGLQYVWAESEKECYCSMAAVCHDRMIWQYDRSMPVQNAITVCSRCTITITAAITIIRQQSVRARARAKARARLDEMIR